MWTSPFAYLILCFENVVNWVRPSDNQNTDIYFELDIHDYTKKSCARIARQLVSVCKKNPKILNRFLIQVHNQKMYNGFYSVYHFKYFQYVSSAAVKKNIKDAISFCRKNKIGAIALRTSLASKETIQKLKKSGLVQPVLKFDLFVRG